MSAMRVSRSTPVQPLMLERVGRSQPIVRLDATRSGRVKDAFQRVMVAQITSLSVGWNTIELSCVRP
jgi:hypothetical protein